MRRHRANVREILLNLFGAWQVTISDDEWGLLPTSLKVCFWVCAMLTEKEMRVMPRSEHIPPFPDPTLFLAKQDK